jgi:HD-GYP domain-containing protein (c-di-GMP phosphodiesterase class II)
MNFSLNKFLISVTFVLDFIEIDILDDITNHGKRVGYIALKIGEELNLTKNEEFNLLAFAIMHDIGGVKNKGKVSKSEMEKAKEHCVIGEEDIMKFPFTSEYKNVILYHHENYDGSGFFNKAKDEIPLFSQIISIADSFELLYDPEKNREELLSKIKEQKNKMFSEKMVKTFLKITQNESFWLNLKDQFILSAIKTESPQVTRNYSLSELHEITSLFSDIIDSKSRFTNYHSTKLSRNVEIMADYYDFGKEKRDKLLIAADLHDIGKMAISNSILDKPGSLTKEEYKKVKAHTFYTRKALETIDGFEEITEWASNHHERNDGSGYPYGLTEKKLDFPSQILAALDVYQALRENRPYREPMNHNEAVKILKTMAANNKLNKQIVDDIDQLFK